MGMYQPKRILNDFKNQTDRTDENIPTVSSVSTVSVEIDKNPDSTGSNFDLIYTLAKQARDKFFVPGILAYADVHRKDLVWRIQKVEADLERIWIGESEGKASSPFQSFKQLLNDWVTVHQEMNQNYLIFLKLTETTDAKGVVNAPF